jgi:hypothetical protein
VGTKKIELTVDQVADFAQRIPDLYAEHYGDMCEIGKELGYSRQQMYGFCGRYPEIGAAVKEALEAMKERVRATMAKGALAVSGYNKALPNTMFWLKAKDDWTDRVTVTSDSGFVLPSSETASSLDDRPALTLVKKIEPGASK